MKQVLICLMFASVIIAGARPITEQEAVCAARNYLKKDVFQKQQVKTISHITPLKKDGELLGYAIDLDPDGFFLVPAFTELSPINIIPGTQY